MGTPFDSSASGLREAGEGSAIASAPAGFIRSRSPFAVGPCGSRLRQRALGTDDRGRFISRVISSRPLVQDPCGFPCDTQRLLKLADGDPPLCVGNEVDRLKPEMQLEMAGLETSADLDREWPEARVALVRIATGAFALQLSDLFPRVPAMWAYRACRPEPRLAEGNTRRPRCGSGVQKA